MKARSCLLLLPMAIAWAGAAEPKPRPRLPAPVLTEIKREQPASAPASGYRSFDDYLQTTARRPVGLEAIPEVAAARTEKAAAEKAVAGTSSTSGTTVATGPDVLVLPKLEITAEKMTQLEKKLAALEANQSWETSSAEAWKTRSEGGLVLDKILNPPFLRLGSYSGGQKTTGAGRRVEMLRWIAILEIMLEEAKTPAEKARIQADIDVVTDITRHWE